MKKVYIIAEAGVNHNGNEELAFDLVDIASDAGADAVKFQTFKAKNLVTKFASKADYQKIATKSNESQFDMLQKLELNFETHRKLRAYCVDKKIKFLSTAFDSESLNFLHKDLCLSTLKIPSGEITNGPLLLEYGKTGCQLILSTGMSTLDEIETALGVLAFGLLNKKNPSKQAFEKSFHSKQGQSVLKKNVTLLHCTTQYPTPIEDVNLNAMVTMKEKFGLNIGYSDHTEGILVPVMASVLGATVIEKHFTISKNHEGPDHSASLEPTELKMMVSSIRSVADALGNGVKKPAKSEHENINVARKSLVASKSIRFGEEFTKNNLTIKRPGTGINPMNYWDRLGQISKKDYDEDEVIY